MRLPHSRVELRGLLFCVVVVAVHGLRRRSVRAPAICAGRVPLLLPGTPARVALCAVFGLPYLELVIAGLQLAYLNPSFLERRLSLPGRDTQFR